MKVYDKSGVFQGSADTDRAPLASPSFTGTPLAPTAAVNTSSFQIATTAFVIGQTVMWSSVSGTTQSAVTNKGYVSLDSSLVTVTLPATASVGDSVSITGYGSGKWKLAQNASQTINLLGTPTTAGVGGYLAATTRYDCITVRCVVANTTWVAESCAGAITVV